MYAPVNGSNYTVGSDILRAHKSRAVRSVDGWNICPGRVSVRTGHTTDFLWLGMSIGCHNVHILGGFCHYGDVACPSPTLGSVGQYIYITDIRVLQKVFGINVTIIRSIKTWPCIFIRSLYVVVVLAYSIDIFREHSFQCNRQRERYRQLVIQS